MKKCFWLMILFLLISPLLLFSQTVKEVAGTLDADFKKEALSFIKDSGNYNIICSSNEGQCASVALNEVELSKTFYVFFGKGVNFTKVNSDTRKEVEWVKKLLDLQTQHKNILSESPTKEGLKAYEDKVIADYISFLKGEKTGEKAIFLDAKVDILANKLKGQLVTELGKLPKEEAAANEASIEVKGKKSVKGEPNVIGKRPFLSATLLGVINSIGVVFLLFTWLKQKKDSKSEDVNDNIPSNKATIEKITAENTALKERDKALEQRIATLEATKKTLSPTIVPRLPKEEKEIQIRYANEIKSNSFQSLSKESFNAKYKLTIQQNSGTYVVIDNEHLGEGRIEKEGKNWKITQIVQEPIRDRTKIYAQPPSELGFLHLSYEYDRGSTSYVIEVDEDGNTGEFYLYENELNYEDALKRFDTVLRYACNLPANMDLRNSKRAIIPKDGWGKVRKVNGKWQITSKATVKFLK
jgi:hypothetical protein